MWESDPVFSPDGTHVAYLYSDGDPQVALTQVYVTSPSGGLGTAIFDTLDRPIGNAVWSPDSQGLIATAPDGLTNALWRVGIDATAQRYDTGNLVPGIPLDDDRRRRIAALSGAAARNGTLAFVATATGQPPELYVRSMDGSVTRLTNFNAAIAGRAWAPAQRIVFATQPV